MRPFSISEKCKSLRDTYPQPAVLSDAIKGIAHLELLAILRLWFSEGIPYAFRANPMLYEVIREWMAMRLQTKPKNLTIIGSLSLDRNLASNRTWTIRSLTTEFSQNLLALILSGNLTYM